MFNFPGKQPDEKVLMVLHRHPMPFIKDILRVVALALIPAILVWIGFNVTSWSLENTSLGYAVFVGVAILYYVFLATLLYGFWLNYYLDFFVITTRRIIDIEQRGLLSRTVSEQPLYRIQDVTSEVVGVWAHLFHYGNVYIQTAGEKERFIFEQVANPENVVRTILSLTDKIVRDHDHEHIVHDQP